MSVNGWHFVGLYTKVYTLNSQQNERMREMRSLANWFDYEIMWATTVIAVKYTYSSYWCDFCVQHTSVRVRMYYVKNKLKLPFCDDKNKVGNNIYKMTGIFVLIRESHAM